MKDLFELKSPWAKGSEMPQTPFYIYSEPHLESLVNAYTAALKGTEIQTHFALKSNNNPQILKFFKNRGFGLDLVSGVELSIALANGFSGEQLLFSGVGKSNEELELAVKNKVSVIVVESSGELERLNIVALAAGTRARIAFRVNPDVDAKTHPYISTGMYEHKFGIDFEEAAQLYSHSRELKGVEAVGMSVHIGSQMLDLSALESALKKSLNFASELKQQGIPLSVFDAGGGVGVPYSEPGKYPPFENYGALLKNFEIEWKKLQGPSAKVFTEVGRALVAQAGFLLTRILGVKVGRKKNFAIVDASMTELLRPALYQAVHPIDLWMKSDSARGPGEKLFDVVGPVCESSDVLGRDRRFSELIEGDVLRISCAGAYGYVMASHYNGRSIPSEYWINQNGQLNLSRPAIPYKV